MSVTAPLGFRAAGVAAGLKESGQPDVAVVLNDGPSRAAAAVFTANRVQAAPVTWTRQVVSGGRVRAVVPHPAPVTLSFTPTLAPMARGILATCTARLVASGPASAPDAGARLRDVLAAAYGPEPFVHLLPEGRWPATGATLGSNMAHLQVAADTHAGRAVVVCALDNLVKGAAGQAVQIANLMLGLPETTGLTAYGVTP